MKWQNLPRCSVPPCHSSNDERFMFLPNKGHLIQYKTTTINTNHGLIDARACSSWGLGCETTKHTISNPPPARTNRDGNHKLTEWGHPKTRDRHDRGRNARQYKLVNACSFCGLG